MSSVGQRSTLDITHAVRFIWTGRTRREHDDEWRRPFYKISNPPSTLDRCLFREESGRRRRRRRDVVVGGDSEDSGDNGSGGGEVVEEVVKEVEEEEEGNAASIYMDRGVWGPECDPISQMWIFATWPKFPEGAFVETEEYSSLNYDQAPEWYVRCHPNKSLCGDVSSFESPDVCYEPWASSTHAFMSLWQESRKWRNERNERNERKEVMPEEWVEMESGEWRERVVVRVRVRFREVCVGWR